MRVLLLALVGLFVGSVAFGQDAVGDYRSNTASGLWSTAASWQRCSVAGSPGIWVTAVAAPTAAASGVITIRSGHTITVSATANADQFIIASGGSLIINSPRTLTIADGAGTDLTINGTMTVNGTILVNGSAVANSAFGIGAGGNLTISGTGSSFNVNNANYSTAVSSNITVTSPGTFSSDASSNATIAGNINGTGTYTSLALTTFSSNTNITNTGTKTFNDVTVTGTVNASANTISVNGNLLNNGSVNCSAGTLTLNGNLVNNGGISCSAGAWVFSGTSKSISTTGSPVQTDFFDVTISSNAGITASIPFNAGGNLVVSGTAPVGSLTANNFFSVGGAMTVNGILTTPAGFDTQGALTVSGAGGSLTSNTVSFQTAGLLTVSGGAVLTANAGFDATAGITVTGASSVLTANNQFTVGGPFAVNTSGVFNASADGVISANLSGTGTFTSTALTTFDGTTVVSGAGSKTFNNVLVTGSLTTSGAATVNGNLNIADGATAAVNSTLQVNGTTSIGGGTSGAISFATGGTKTLVGLVTVNTGGTWTNTNAAITFRGGITNNGTFSGGTGVQTFNTNAQVLTGIFTIPSVTVTGVTLTNTNSLTVATALTGTGGLTQGTGATLNLGGTSAITTLTASASSNTVNYTGAAQTVKNIAYVHLGLSGSGVKTLQVGTTAIGGDLTLSGTVSTTAVVGLTIGGKVDIGSGTSFTAGAFTHNVAGDWIQNGTFSGTGSTINLNGAPQSISGSSVNFDNLTLAGTGTKSFGTSTTITSALSINSGVVADLGSITTHTANSLVLSGSAASSGTWGSTGSSATFKNDTYFLSSSSGLITIAIGTFTYYSRANGNWNNPTTWSTVSHASAVNVGTYPVAGNTVVIGGGFTVTLAGPEASATVSFANGSSITNTLDLSGNTLTLSGAITIPQITTSGANILAVGSGTLNAGNNIDFTNGSAGGTGHRLTISTGTATVTGNVTGTGTSSTVQFTGAGTLQLAGTFYSPANGTLTAFAGSTVDYNGTTAQAVQAHTYQNLRASGSGTKTAATATTLNGNLIIADGSAFAANNTLLVGGTTTVGGGTSGTISFATGGTKTFVGLVTVSTGGTWNNAINEAITFRGGITNNGTFTSGTAVQTFDTNAQILTGTFTIPSVTVTGAAVTLTNTNSLTVATALAGTGGLTQGTGATLNLGGTSAITTLTATASSNTVNYTGAAQTVKNVAYFHLGLSGSGVKTLQAGTTAIGGDLTLSGTVSTTGVVGLTIAGKVDIGSGTNFTAGAFTHNVGGNWIQNGTFTSTGSTINLNGAAQSISGSSVGFNNLTLAGTGTKSFGASTAITSILSINSGVIADLGSITTHTANSLLLSGSTASSGTWGSTGSSATFKNDTYFLNSSSGLITITIGTVTYYSRANGNWNNPTTWSTVSHASAVNLGTYPVAGSTVIIGGGFTVTLAGPEASATVSFAGGSSITNTLDLSGNTLTISGPITIPQITTSGANILAVGSGTLNAGNNIDFTNGSAGGTGHRLTISTGTATVTGNVTGTGTSSTVQFTGAGTLQLGGTFYTPANGTLTAFAGSTVDYNGATAQAVQAHTYQNLRASGSGTKTAAAATTLNGNLIIADGSTLAATNTLLVNGTTTVGGGVSGVISFATGGTKTFVGLVTVSTGGTWNNTANEAVTYRGGITNNGTFTAGTAVQTFNTNAQVLTGTIVIPSVTVTGVTVTNTNSLTVGTALIGTGGLTQGTGAILNIGGTSTITTLTATANTNTVNYAGAGQTVRPIAYYHLGLSGSGTKTLQAGTTSIGGDLTLSGTVSTTGVVGLTIGGKVDIGSGTTFTAGAFTHNVGGDWIQNGTFTSTGSTINMNGSAQSISGSSVGFNNLTLAGTGTKSFGASTAIASALSINSGVIVDLGSITTHTANSLLLSGSTASSGTWGSTASSATFKTDTYFSSGSSGIITISTGTFTYYSRANGNWNNATTWSTVSHASAVNLGTYPVAANAAVIGGGFTVTLAGPEASATVSFASGSSITNTLDLSGNTLTISGPITIPQITTSGANILAVGSGTLNAGNNIDFTNGSAGGTGHRLTISTGTATVTGNVTGTGTSSTIQFTGAGTLQLAGAFYTPAQGTLTAFAGSTVDYNGTIAQTVQAHTYQNLRISGNGTKTASSATTLNGNLIIADGSTFASTNNLLVNGTSTIGGGASGIISFATGGTKTFVGLVTLNTGATWTNANRPVIFRGGVTNNGTFTAGTGIHTFNTNSQTLTGTFTIPRVTVTGAAITLTNTNSLTVNTALAGTGGLTQSTGAILNIGGTSAITTLTASASGNAVNYTGATQTVKAITYHHLGISGSGTKSAAATASTTTVNGNLNIADGPTFTANNTLTVIGSTTVGGGTSGIISFGATGAKTFGGLVTINAGGTWTNAVNRAITFQGGITNNGTFTAGTGIQTFDTNSQTLTGTFTIPSVTVTGITLTNTNSLTVNTDLAGTGGLTQSSGAILNIGGTSGITALIVAASGNTVNYTGAVQTVKNVDYENLGLSGTGNKTFAGSIAIANNLSISTGTKADLSNAFTHSANSLTLAGTLQAAGTWGSSASSPAAAHLDDNYFNGNGLVTITFGSDTFYSRANGNWNANTTWSNFGFSGPAATSTPVAGSSVNIGSTRTVTVTANASSKTLSFTNGSLLISTQTVTVSGDVTGTGASSIIQFTGAGTLQLGGAFFSPANGTLTTFSGSTIEYNGSTSQTVQAHAYQNLTLSGSGNKTFAASIAIADGLSINTGAKADLSNANTHTANSLTLAGALQTSGTWGSTLSAATNQNNTFFNGTGLVTITSGLDTFYSRANGDWNTNTTWSNTGFNGPVAASTPVSTSTVNIGNNRTVTVTSNASCTTLSVAVGSLSISTPTVTVSGNVTGTGTSSNIQFTGTGTLQLGGTFFSPANGTLTPFAGSTVEYNAGAQTVEGHTYANLLLSGTGIKTLTTGVTSVTGNLTLSGAVSTTGVIGLTIGGNVAIGSGTTFTAGTFTHNVAGNWTNSGTFTHSNGTINFNGATQNIAAGGNDFYNISFSNGTQSTLTSSLRLINVLNVLSDNTNLNSAGFLTLVSTAANTAVIGSLAGTNRTVTGNVNVQRYIAGVGRFYRDISSPVATPVVQQIINSGITVTGNFTGSSYPCAGCATNNASLFYYIESTAGAQNLGYQAYPLPGGNSNASTLTTGRGYNVLIRNELGSPTLTLTGNINSAPSTPITLATSYTSTSGGAANDGWNFVGNPFPCTIDWDSPSGWTKPAGIQGNQISVWDPTKGTTGAYRTWNGTSGDLGSGRIAPGQGFWVQLSSAGGSLSVTEAVKTTSPLGSFLRKGTDHFVEIAIVNSTGEDKAYIQKTQGSSKNYDLMDGPKLESPEGLNLYAVTEDNVRVSVNAMDEILKSGTVSLYISNFVEGTYSLSQNSFGDFQNVTISVLDKFTNTISDLAGGKQYAFTATEDPASRSPDRFTLIFGDSESTKIVESVSLYPNPTSGYVYLSVNSIDQPDGQVMDGTGKSIGQVVWKYDSQRKIWKGDFNVGERSVGLYFARIRVKENVSVIKFIKN